MGPKLLALTLWLLAALLPAAARAQAQSPDGGAAPALTEEQQQYLSWAKGIWNSLDRKQGKIELPGGVATLNVPDTFYYLGPDDSEKVLVDVWKNPPGEKPLGMLFPTGSTPFDSNAWAVTIEYEEDGYVSDKDADEINYDELLADMQRSTTAANEERTKAGYDPVKLIGWASKPYYDKQTHKLHWAKELKFGDEPAHTLNYNIRVLGRKGVLVLNFIADMDQHEAIKSNLSQVLAMADFNDGYRYEEFDPSIDKVAAYGIGALVAGKLLAKAGLFAMALVFLKKIGLLIVAAGAVAAKLFKRNKAPAQG